MRYSLQALKERIRSARRRRGRQSFRNNSFGAQVETLEDRRVLAPLVTFGFFGVPENSPADTSVGNVVVLDAVGDVTFAIIGGNDSPDGDANPAFRINSTTGQLFVNDQGDLDFEGQQNFVLTVAATDDEGTGQNSQVISLSDVAENTVPDIDDPGEVLLPENSPNGTDVVTITASDPEGDALDFTLPGGGNIDSDGDEIPPFAIANVGGSSAIISVLDTDDINFEGGLPNPFELVVRATDTGQGAFFSEITVTIDVTDQNDSPVLTRTNPFTIPENTANTTFVGTLTATDEDAGQAVTFTLNPDPANDIDGDGRAPFTLNSNGTLRVRDSGDLNFELTTFLIVSYTATDNNTDPGDPDPISNPASTTGTIRVNLLNIIENRRPVANDDEFDVSENAEAGTVVGTPVATDADAGQSLTYEITAGNLGEGIDLDGDGNGPLAMDPDTGEITVGDIDDLDNSVNPIITLTYKVTDDGEDNLMDTGTVIVNVLDVNDAPVFEPQSVGVAENSAADTLVGDPLVASDPNGDDIVFSIPVNEDGDAGNDVPFDLGATDGQLTVAAGAELDFETISSYTFDVMVVDNGVPPEAVVAEVTVQIQNALENNPPVVADVETPVFAENQLPGTVITEVVLTDEVFPGQIPAGQTYSWEITGGNPGDAFEVVSTGALTANIVVLNQFEMDFEGVGTFNLEVTAFDDGEGELDGTGIVTIPLSNANDPPRGVEDQLGISNETDPLGTRVGELPFGNDLSVSFEDEDATDTHMFSLVGQRALTTPPGDNPIDVGPAGEEEGAFVIDPTFGFLSVANTSLIDFDALIEIPDDFDPEDTETPLPALTIELDVVVTDQLGLASDPFTVTTVIRNMDDNTDPAGQDQGGFDFYISNDGGGDGEVDDELFANLSDNAAMGDCTAQLSPDHGTLAFVGCSTDSTEDGTAYIVADDPTSTDFLVTDIGVTDGAMDTFVWTPFTQRPNPLFGEEDEPEFIPAPFGPDELRELLEEETLFLVFDLPGGLVAGEIGSDANGTDAFTVDENADGQDNLAAGTEVGQLTVSDPEGYPVTYEIIGGNTDNDEAEGDQGPAFGVSETGMLLINDPDEIDADTRAQYTLTIRVTDQPTVPNFAVGHPSFVFAETPRSSTFIVEVNVRNLNDAPSMDPAQQFGSVLENATPLVTRVGSPVSATDGDGDALTYSIVNGDEVPYGINPDTGQIFVTGPIDFEAGTGFHQLIIEVTDGEFVSQGLFLVLILNVPENTAPVAPDRVNEADPSGSGVQFDLLDVDEEEPTVLGSCTYTFNPFEALGGGGELGSLNLVCMHDLAAPTSATLNQGDDVVVEFESAASPIVLTLDQTFTSDTLADFEALQAALLAGELSVVVNGSTIAGDLPIPAQDQLTVNENTADQPLVQGQSIGFYTGASDPEGTTLTYGVSSSDLDGDGNEAVGIDPDTGELFVNDPDDFNYERQKTILATVSVTDAPAVDAALTSFGIQQINVLDLNDSPQFGPQPSLFSSVNKLWTTIGGSDVDLNQVFADSTFSVINIETTGITQQAIDPDAIFALGLFVDTSLFPNFFGFGEQWLRAAPVGPGGAMDWYILLPTGEFIRWDNTPGQVTGDSQGFFGLAAVADPVGEIVDAAVPGDYPLPSEIELEIDETKTGFGLDGDAPNHLTVTRLTGAGVATVTLQVCDAVNGSFCDTEEILVNYGENIPPVLDPIGDQVSAPAADTIEIPLSATDGNAGAELTFDVALSSIEADLNDELDFFIDGDIFFDALGALEVWVKSAVNNKWYFILPNNEIYLWDGLVDPAGGPSGTLIEQLNDGVYANLNLLTNPSGNVPATAEIVDGTLIITRDAGFTGSVNVTVGVEDGADRDQETFRATFTN